MNAVNVSLVNILQAILLTAEQPLSLEQLTDYFSPEEGVSKQDIRVALQQLNQQCQQHSFALVEIASGFRLQTRTEFQTWVQRHSSEKPAKYSRAFLETLALIAWRQPITRAEIEAIRGVAVNANIIKTLFEREWVRVLGHKEIPGRPEMLGTTRQFLDYFGLKSLDDLPSLTALQNLDKYTLPLAFE